MFIVQELGHNVHLSYSNFLKPQKKLVFNIKNLLEILCTPPYNTSMIELCNVFMLH